MRGKQTEQPVVFYVTPPTGVLCPIQNHTWLVDLFIISIASVQQSLVSDTIVLISVVHWSHFRHICLCFRMWLCEIDSILKPSQGNELACSKKQYLYPPIMWLSAWLTCDSSPMPILDQTRITWATWAIWITDFTPFSVNHPSKDRLTWRSHCSFQFIFLHHCFIVCHRQPLEWISR